MTAKADNDSCGQQQHARLGHKLQRGRIRAGGKRRQRNRVAIMAATAKDGGGGQQRWQTTKTAMADKHSGGQERQRTMTPRKIGWRTTRGKEESGRQTTMALDKMISPQGRECEKIKKPVYAKRFFSEIRSVRLDFLLP
jgi:hypothetical protein